MEDRLGRKRAALEGVRHRAPGERLTARARLGALPRAALQQWCEEIRSSFCGAFTRLEMGHPHWL